MPNQNNDNSLQDILELLTNNGLDQAGEALRMLLNAAMILERENSKKQKSQNGKNTNAKITKAKKRDNHFSKLTSGCKS